MKGLKKIISFSLVAGLTISALAGCAASEQGSSNSSTIKIGGIAPLTGEVAVYGQAAKNGAQLAIDQYNDKGGILGKKIDFIVYDDKGDTKEAVNAYRKLTSSDKVDAIIGAVTSKPTLAVTPLAAKDKIPLITPTATAVDVTTAGENIFRACFIDPYQGKVMAAFAFNDLNVSTAAVMYNTADDYSTGLAEAFKEYFESKGGTITNFEGYTKDEKDYKSILTKINEGKPEVLFIPDYYNRVGLIAQQVKEVGIEATLLGADGWDGVLDVAPEAVEGAYFDNHYSPDDTAKEVQDFLKAYQEEYNETPNALAALGYDAALVLIQAIERAGSTDKAKIVEELNATDVTSATGRIKYDENRNPMKSAPVLKIEGGQSKFFKSVNP